MERQSFPAVTGTEGSRSTLQRPLVIGMLLLVVLAAACGCTLRGMAINAVAGVAEEGIGAFERDDDPDLIAAAIPAHIKLMETLLESRPESERLLVLLSRLYGSYGFLFFEPALEALRLGVPNVAAVVDPCRTPTVQGLTADWDRYVTRGGAYAVRALEIRHPACREKLARVHTIGPFLNTLTQKDVPALFWYGFSLAQTVNLHRDSMKSLSRAHVAEKAMLRVLDLDPEYYHGMAHLVLMIYYGSRSPMIGGDPEAAAVHYEKFKQVAGEDFLLAHVLYARYCLYQAQDRGGFTEVLSRIAAHPVSRGRYGLYNRNAVSRAVIYLAAADRLF